MRQIFAGIAASLLLLIGVSACSAEPVPVPDVVGQSLDEAQKILKDGGFEEVKKKDSIHNRSIWSRANWVVLDQQPAGGTSLAKDTEILLHVAKLDDSELRANDLPDESPLRAQVVEREKEEARGKRQQAAEERQAVEDFVDKIDPSARGVQEMITDLGDLRQRVEADGGLTIGGDAQLQEMELPIKVYAAAFSEPPRLIEADAARVKKAVEEFGRAEVTLRKANGAAVAGSIERFDQLYISAVEEYNKALTGIYNHTSVSAPTV